MTAPSTHRLCLASPVFYPTYGGSQRRFMSYLPGLRERGLDIRVYTGTPNAKEMSAEETALWGDCPTGEFMPTTEVAGVPVHRVKLPDKKGAARTQTYNDRLLEYCRIPEYRPDVIQMVGPLKPMSMPLLRQLQDMGIKLIYAVTIAPPEPSKKKWFKRSHSRGDEAALFNLLDCIVTNNTPLRDFVQTTGVTTRIEVIANGVDLERFYPARSPADRDPLRTRLGIAPDDIMITSIGGISPRKGSDLMVEAWAQLAAEFPNLHLVLIGPRKDLEQPKLKKFRRRMEKSIRRSGAPGRVHFTGLVDNVEDYQRATDILVLPSEREGMPNAVLEAMASRAAVIMTPYKGLCSDMGEAGIHYLLSERNSGALATAVRQLVENPERRLELAVRGFERIRDTLSLDKSLDRYAALYHELAETGR
ncbi:MAG TPA: glycosyltransferase family 1 protein [Gammaproteobacteria bacterium]|nr:glycosyltransferase family 1 protein [Gammaproteobacteria bacterium]